MKHLATFILVALSAMTAGAGSINWKIGGASNKFYDSTGSELASVDAYLLLSENYSNWTDNLSNPSTISEIASVLTSLSLDGPKEYVDLSTSGEFTSSSTSLTVGTRYDFYLIVVNPSTGEYLDLGMKNQGAYKDGETATTISWTAAQSVFTTNPAKSQYNANAWHSVPMVPEPSSAALALAGLALLLKRRRA